MARSGGPPVDFIANGLGWQSAHEPSPFRWLSCTNRTVPGDPSPRRNETGGGIRRAGAPPLPATPGTPAKVAFDLPAWQVWQAEESFTLNARRPS